MGVVSNLLENVNALCKPNQKSIEGTGFGGTIKPGKDKHHLQLLFLSASLQKHKRTTPLHYHHLSKTNTVGPSYFCLKQYVRPLST